MEKQYASLAGACVGAATAPDKSPTLLNDVGILLARVEANEYTVARIAARIFGAQPESATGQCEVSPGDVIESDVLRAARSASRTRELLEALEVRLG